MFNSKLFLFFNFMVIGVFYWTKASAGVFSILIMLESLSVALMVPLCYLCFTEMLNDTLIFFFLVISVCTAILGLSVMILVSRYSGATLINLIK